MNLEECEKVYGKFIKEEENFYHFQGKAEHGIAVMKHFYWNFPQLNGDNKKKDDETGVIREI